ncbi:ferredoxin reductase [Janibacter sp. G1551]|uniref:ferredoxin reductase n=1 Tax=Janibacter sp. G1551 TaxID=3420440 RepID=UPI003D0243D1
MALHLDSPPAPRAASRARDLVAGLVRAATTPLVPSDYLDLIAPLSNPAALRGRIVDITPETADAATITIRPGRGWAGHVPGQYIRIGIDVDGVRQWRAYSLTSPADAPGGLITITVKAMTDGVVSNHLVRRARPGTLVHLDQATGDFTLPSPLPERILFLTAGSGITPVMGMLRHLDRWAGATDITLVHSAPMADDVIFAGELRELAARGVITLHERHTRSAGIVEPAHLDELVPDWRDRQTWACGPTAMLDALEEHHAAAGLADAVHTERFRPVVIAPGEGGTVTFLGAGVEVDADGSTPLLDAGEDAGVLMPSGCRMGICYGCVVPLRRGVVRDLRDGSLTVAEDGDSIPVQTCISAVAGACEIDL